jgi:hypothetical protein
VPQAQLPSQPQTARTAKTPRFARAKPEDKSYVNQAPFGSMDPKERLALLDQEGLDKALICPTLGLSWEAEDVEDLALQAAYARAYNRWVVDFCADSRGRPHSAHLLWRR